MTPLFLLICLLNVNLLNSQNIQTSDENPLGSFTVAIEVSKGAVEDDHEHDSVTEEIIHAKFEKGELDSKESHSVTDEVINAKFEEGEFTMMSEPFIQATLEGGDLQADSKEITTQNTVSEEETKISGVGIINSVEEEQEETSESQEIITQTSNNSLETVEETITDEVGKNESEEEEDK